MMLLILSLLLIALHLPSKGAADLQFVGYYCPVDGYSYGEGSTFRDNLNVTLFTNLAVNASSQAFSRFTTGEGVDQIYAMYYCRGDVGIEACHNCVQTAATRVLSYCNLLKQGIVWYQECTLRYANETIFALNNQDLTVSFPYYNNTPVMGDYLNEYRPIFDRTMRNLIDLAAHNDTLKLRGFATARANLSAYQTLHGLVQCAPVITGSSCQSCLTAAIRHMDLWTTTMEFLPDCLVGFEINGSPPPAPPPPSSSRTVIIKLVIPLVSVVVLLFFLGGFCYWKHHRSSKGDQHPPPAKERSNLLNHVPDEYDASFQENPDAGELGRQHGLAQFTYSQVEGMTNGFQNILGEGGYAVVYHGCLADGRTEIAVKLFCKNEAPKQFSTEIEVLGRISHKNLVSLVGYCEEGTNLALLYEFMASGDLKGVLSEHFLTWRKRVEIALDTAQGLDYLHNGCSQPIVHRDVKPANILLTRDYRAKVADFGFSKIFPAEYVSHLQSRVVGTFGYLDPQYNLTGQVNEKGDVYSFGIVLLELITGKTAIVNRVINLGQWVRSVLERGEIESILDPRLTQGINDNYLTVWKAVELAVRCVNLQGAERPTMAHIIIELKECLAMMNTENTSTYKDSLEMLNAAYSSSSMSPTPR